MKIFRKMKTCQGIDKVDIRSDLLDHLYYWRAMVGISAHLVVYIICKVDDININD